MLLQSVAAKGREGSQICSVSVSGCESGTSSMFDHIGELILLIFRPATASMKYRPISSRTRHARRSVRGERSVVVSGRQMSGKRAVDQLLITTSTSGDSRLEPYLPPSSTMAIDKEALLCCASATSTAAPFDNVAFSHIHKIVFMMTAV